eukprot:10559326-Lingulodinium_polyedra.AAC.1
MGPGRGGSQGTSSRRPGPGGLAECPRGRGGLWGCWPAERRGEPGACRRRPGGPGVRFGPGRRRRQTRRRLPKRAHAAGGGAAMRIS